MSAVTSSRRWVTILLLGALLGLSLSGLVGCGGDKEIDPYVYGSLRGVTTGAVRDTVGRVFLLIDGLSMRKGSGPRCTQKSQSLACVIE